jgi:uncharacterized membrane protein
VIVNLKGPSCFFYLVLLFAFNPLYAHKGETHDEKTDKIEIQENNPRTEAAYKRVNELYIEKIKPVFKNKCFDCHSNSTVYPWYYKVPGVKQIIDKDIREAKEHLDFSSDFPFAGHGEPLEDLEEVKEVLEEGSMPPWNYRLMHSNSSITTKEKKTILEWIEAAERLIRDSKVRTANE